MPPRTSGWRSPSGPPGWRRRPLRRPRPAARPRAGPLPERPVHPRPAPRPPRAGRASSPRRISHPGLRSRSPPRIALTSQIVVTARQSATAVVTSAQLNRGRHAGWPPCPRPGVVPGHLLRERVHRRDGRQHPQRRPASIQHAFDASISGAQWTLDAYTLTLSSFLMLSASTGGPHRAAEGLPDRPGRLHHRLAPVQSRAESGDAHHLPGRPGRRGQHAQPGRHVDHHQHVHRAPGEGQGHRGLGRRGGVSVAAGPLVGGALVEFVGWRSVFWVNIPIGIAAFVIAGLRRAGVERRRSPGSSIPAGQLLVIASVFLLTFGIIEAPNVGWGRRRPCSPGRLGGLSLRPRHRRTASPRAADRRQVLPVTAVLGGHRDRVAHVHRAGRVPDRQHPVSAGHPGLLPAGGGALHPADAPDAGAVRAGLRTGRRPLRAPAVPGDRPLREHLRRVAGRRPGRPSDRSAHVRLLRPHGVRARLDERRDHHDRRLGDAQLAGRGRRQHRVDHAADGGRRSGWPSSEASSPRTSPRWCRVPASPPPTGSAGRSSWSAGCWCSTIGLLTTRPVGAAGGLPEGARASAGEDRGIRRYAHDNVRMARAVPLGPDDPTVVGEYRITGKFDEPGPEDAYLATDPHGISVVIRLLAAVAEPDRVTAAVGPLKGCPRSASAQVPGSGTLGDRPYVVSEHVDGPTLAEAVQENGVLTERRCTRLAVGTIERGGRHPPGRGVLHGDIRPGRWCSGPTAPEWRISGLTRRCAPPRTTVTRHVGKPAYRAPEEFSDAQAGAPRRRLRVGGHDGVRGHGTGPLRRGLGRGDGQPGAARPRRSRRDRRRAAQCAVGLPVQGPWRPAGRQ